MPQVWTPERRAAQAARMRQRWAAGNYKLAGDKRRWCFAEDRVLRLHAGREPLHRLVELVNAVGSYPRSFDAVKCRLSALGLSAWVASELSVSGVAHGLGRSACLVRRWIRRGLLEARPGGNGTPHPQGGVPWIVERQAVDAMLRADPWLIDPADIRDPSWRALVQVERRVAQRRRGRKEVAA